MAERDPRVDPKPEDSWAKAEITRLRSALTARDERARQCVEVLGVKLTNPSGEPFDELSKAVQVVSMNHANELMARDEAIRVAEEALKNYANPENWKETHWVCPEWDGWDGHEYAVVALSALAAVKVANA